MSLLRRRLFYDAFARHGIAVGGSAVIAAVVLIFFYLLAVVVPIFQPASVEDTVSYARPAGDARIVHVEVEELGEDAVRVLSDGRVEYFKLKDG
ncbi:MAG: phosphate ABC transporter permease, partial [Gammaproteobacteria bacterium]